MAVIALRKRSIQAPLVVLCKPGMPRLCQSMNLTSAHDTKINKS